MKILRLAGAFAIGFVLLACQPENPTPQPNKPITEISFGSGALYATARRAQI